MIVVGHERVLLSIARSHPERLAGLALAYCSQLGRLPSHSVSASLSYAQQLGCAALARIDAVPSHLPSWLVCVEVDW